MILYEVNKCDYTKQLNQEILEELLKKDINCFEYVHNFIKLKYSLMEM